VRRRRGSSHEAYLKAMSPTPNCITIQMTTALRLALRAARVDVISGTRYRWRFGSTAPIRRMLRVSRGGPLSRAALGEGFGIGVRKGKDLLRQEAETGRCPRWGKSRYTICGCGIFRSVRLNRSRHCESEATKQSPCPSLYLD